MANTNVSHGEVKSICDALEISPSQHDASGNYGGAPNVSPTGKNSEPAAGKHHLATHTSEFKMKTAAARDHSAGYKGRFAKGAKQPG